MRNKQKKLFLIFSVFILSCYTHQAIAQANLSTVPATGGDATGSGGTSSYSVGQVVYITNTGSNGSIAQGVQQPYEITVVTNLDEAAIIQLELSAYPNPAVDFLNLNIGEFEKNNLSYQLYNVAGKLLENKKIEQRLTKINMEKLPKAIYFVKVTRNKTSIKTFKIIKK